MNKINFASFLFEYLEENIPSSLSMMVDKGEKKEIHPEKGQVVTRRVPPERIPRIKMHMAKIISKPYAPIAKVNITGK